MLKDTDLFPITCPYCGHKFQEEVAALKKANSVICRRCTRKMRYENQTFADVINDVAGALDRFQRSLGAQEKPS